MRGVEVGSVGKVSVAPAKIGGFPAPRFEMGIKNIANPFQGIETRGAKPNIRVIKNPLPEAKVPAQTVSVVEMGLPSGQEAVDIAEQWLRVSSQPQNNHYIRDREYNERSRQRVIEPIVRPKNFVWTRPEVLPFLYPKPVVKQENQPKIHPNTSQIEFSKSLPASGRLTVLDKRSVQENPVKQFFSEKEVLVEEKADKKPEILEREEIEEWKLKDLLDEETVEQRVYDISEAIDLAEADAKAEGREEIEGWRILKFLRLHIGLISRIARKVRKDGSLDETLEELAARRFSSKNQAKQQAKEIVAKKEPVKRGKEGKTVKEGAVERVFKYLQVSRSPNDEVGTRVVKKAEPVQVQPVAYETKEPRIEDNADLAAVFLRKAA